MTDRPAVPLLKSACPVCSRPTDHAYRPFCSKRCADIDLGRWLKEDYRIPAVEQDDGVDEEE
ncbi:MAG: DNA gyrase inhibitor YacG [Rhodospirillales bacterium]